MRRPGLPLALLLLGLAAPTSAAVDCPAAGTGVPALVCADEALLSLDREMDVVLPQARAHALAGERETLDEQQRRWLERRSACLAKDDPRACVALAYEARLAELRIGYGLLPAPFSETWECGDGSLVIAAFYGGPGAAGGPGAPKGRTRTGEPASMAKGPAPTAVALTRGDRKVVAVLRPSEHGRRYEAEGAIGFWVIGKEANVRWAGKQFTCKPPGDDSP
jgi:uncharacterized protein YecT (DUF1311 family)